ncbi:hypothetical protein BH24ACT21_BH24ACT21_06230 [soil metagenome]
MGGFDTSKRTVDRIHDNSSKAICYVDVGAWENWRPDKKFPKSVLGPEARDREGPLSSVSFVQ